MTWNDLEWLKWLKMAKFDITWNKRNSYFAYTVFDLISTPGAFEIEIWHCQFMPQLAPPVTNKSI